MRHLVAVGACYLDKILTVDHYPAEDEKLHATSITQRRGGNCPNSLDVLVQLLDFEARVAPVPVLICVLPALTSSATKRIKLSFGNTVDLSHCLCREDFHEPPSAYILKSLTADSRTIVNYNVLPEITSHEFVSIANRLGDHDRWFHFEGRTPDVTLECMKHVRRTDPTALISVEVEKPARAGLRCLAAMADVVFYSQSWAEGQGYEGPEDCLRAQAPLTPRASLLCCTWGDQGASALELPSLKYTQSPAYLRGNLEIVDTVGAGDTFIAGMLYGLLCHASGWSIPRRLAFANELAGRKVAQEGFAGLGSSMQHGTWIQNGKALNGSGMEKNGSG